MSKIGRAQKCRDWLRERAPTDFGYRDIAAGIGEPEPIQVAYTMAEMARTGLVNRHGDSRPFTYSWLRDPPPKLPREEIMRRRRDRVRNLARQRGAMCLEDYKELLRQRREARDAERARVRAEKAAQREAERAERAAVREAERAAAKKAKRKPRRVQPACTPKPPKSTQRIAIAPSVGPFAPAPVKQVEPETVAEWMARTGQQPERLPAAWDRE